MKLNQRQSIFRNQLQDRKGRKNHTIGETLIKSMILQTVSTMLGQNAAQKFEEIPLSVRTVKRRTVAISDYIENNLTKKLISSPTFSMQLDKSTDRSGQIIGLCSLRSQ
jgi:hypothetical protein